MSYSKEELINYITTLQKQLENSRKSEKFYRDLVFDMVKEKGLIKMKRPVDKL